MSIAPPSSPTQVLLLPAPQSRGRSPSPPRPPICLGAPSVVALLPDAIPLRPKSIEIERGVKAPWTPPLPYASRQEIAAHMDTLLNLTLDYLGGALSETQLYARCQDYFKAIVRIAPQAMPDEPKRPPRPPRSPFKSAARDDRDQGIDLDERNARVRAAFERGYRRAI